MAARYRYGDLILRKRKTQPAVWQYRWTEDGRRKSMLIGTIKKLPTRSDAERAVEHLRMKINKENPQQPFHSVTVRGLVDRYKTEELPEGYSTRASYLSNLNSHILPRWGNAFLDEVYAMDVEAWLRDLKHLTRSVPLAPKTKKHIRELMHVLFESARRWRLVETNPIELVRQGGQAPVYSKDSHPRGIPCAGP